MITSTEYMQCIAIDYFVLVAVQIMSIPSRKIILILLVAIYANSKPIRGVDVSRRAEENKKLRK